jgi:hypothetical protein
MALAVRFDSKHAQLALVMAPLLAFGCGSDRGPSDDVGQESPDVSGKPTGGVSSAGTSSSPPETIEHEGGTTSCNGGRFANAEAGGGSDAAGGAQGREAGAAGEPTAGRSNDGGVNGDAGAPGGGVAGSPGTDVGGVGSTAAEAGAGDGAGAAASAGSGGAAGALGAAGAAGAGAFGGARPVNGLPCEVQAVLKARCQPCHQDPPLNGAPMRLLTWSDVYGKADEMYAKLSADEMPPPGAPDLSRDQASTLFTYLSLGTPAVGNVTCR